MTDPVLAIHSYLTGEGQILELVSHRFPGFWRFLFPSDFVRLPFPKEEKATCFACPRIQDCGYRSDYRCCTYHPRVPNFALGLASVSAEAHAGLNRALAQGMLLPEGMLASPHQWLQFMQDQEQDLYGKSQTVLCPFLAPDTGACGIHQFRNAVCSTYFCEHDLGEAAEEFWGLVQTLGSQVELLLSQWVLEMLGFDLKSYIQTLNSLAPQLPELIKEEKWSIPIRKSLWGSWYGQELKFYQKCAHIFLQHKSELWTIASQRQLFEAKAFEAALDQLAGVEPIEDDAELSRPSHTWKALQTLISNHSQGV